MLIYVFISTFCILIATAFSRLAWKRFKFCQVLSRIPGPKGLPILGNALQFKNDPHEYLEQLHGWCAKYKEGLFCIWYGLAPVVVIHSPEFAEVALPHAKNINKSQFYELFQPWIGTGVLTSSGEKWKCRRKLITSTFHFKILNSFTPVARDHVKILVQSLKKQCGENKFDISPFITLCTLDVICETAMGVDIMAQQDHNTEYVETVLGLSEEIFDRLRHPWLWNDTIYQLTSGGKRNKKMLEISHGFTNKIINDRINERSAMKSSNASGKPFIMSSSNRKLLALLDLLLEEYDAGNINKEGVREEVDTFLFEGHDTTASALLWTIHLIGKHPKVQAKLQQEADDFFDSIGDVITFEDLKRLEYIECVIKEGLRLFPPAPFFSRRVDEEFCLGPYVVPKGAIYAIMTSMVLRHRDHWKDPNVFKPERFIERNYDIRRHPYAYIPFSAGPRNCIGQRFAMMEMKIIISSIFHHFHINATQETDKIRRTSDVLLRSLEGIWVEITARK